MNSPFSQFIQTLDVRDVISETERQSLERLPFRIEDFRRGEVIVEQCSRPSESCILIRGYAARTVYLHNGSRQLSAVHIPGDFIDLHVFLLKVTDHDIVALTDSSILYIQHRDLQCLISEQPHLGRMLWLMTTIDAAVERAWIACLGRRSAPQHLAHLICELYMRLNIVGMVEDNSFVLPVTQTDISDMLGISSVHANRILQSLRRKGLISWKDGRVKVMDFAALADFAEFTDQFLNLVREPR